MNFKFFRFIASSIFFFKFYIDIDFKQHLTFNSFKIIFTKQYFIKTFIKNEDTIALYYNENNSNLKNFVLYYILRPQAND